MMWSARCQGRCPNVFYVAAGLIVDSRDNYVPYVLSTGGQMYSKTYDTIRLLRELGTGYLYCFGR
ncbi:MAG: hypothetical protein R2741_11190 [Methanolobus sp.]